jgi:hypothetical protein
MTDSEKAIRARIAQLTELFTELKQEDARMKVLMHDHYERLEHHLEQATCNSCVPSGSREFVARKPK